MDKLIPSVLVIIIFLSNACNKPTKENANNKLEGVWKVVEIKNEFNDSIQIIDTPQQGIWIFKDRHYSATGIPSVEARKNYNDSFSPTTDELIEAYNSIVVNTGTYEITDLILTTYPIVSRVPSFSGGKGIYEFLIESDTLLYLTMTEEYSKNGDWASWLDNLRRTIKLIKTNE